MALTEKRHAMSAEGARETSAEKAPYGCDHLHQFVFGRQLSASRSGVTCRRSAPVLGGSPRFTGAGSSPGFIFRDFLLPSRFFFILVHSSFFLSSCFFLLRSCSFLASGLRFYGRLIHECLLPPCFTFEDFLLRSFFPRTFSNFHSCFLLPSFLPSTCFIIVSYCFFFCFISFPFFLASFFLSISFLYSCFLQYSHSLHIYHLLPSSQSQNTVFREYPPFNSL